MRYDRLIALIFALTTMNAADAADIAAGRVAASKCVACHEADDWEGESAASLQSLIADIMAGKVKHKQKIELSAADVANIAAYWAQGKK
jgi:cytochrome c553